MGNIDCYICLYNYMEPHLLLIDCALVAIFFLADNPFNCVNLYAINAGLNGRALKEFLIQHLVHAFDFINTVHSPILITIQVSGSTRSVALSQL